MTPESVKASYLKSLKEIVHVRRYTGTGSNRPRFDVPCRAKVVGFAPHELVGSVVQGDRKAILYADDLLGVGFEIPIMTSDKLVVAGKELQIIAPDRDTRKVDSVLIAYEIQVRG